MSKKERQEKIEDLDAAFIISQAKPRNRELYSSPSKVEEEIPENVSGQNVVKQAPEPIHKEESRRRKSKSQDYESLFVCNSSASTRNGKVVYIRKEFHDRILRIVQVIGYNEISLFSYLDNVLEHHFSTFQGDIEALYDERTPPIF